MIRTVAATRYVTPLREGGSLPAIVEADDLGFYVLKFRGAGQGPLALVAELIAGEIGRALELEVPEVVRVDVDAALGRNEEDPEIRDLLKASVGVNLGLDYLPGSITFDPLAEQPDSALASAIVWHDAFTTNVDRTPRNSNLLMWHRRLWLIDHGAALYFHHAWDGHLDRAASPFALVRDHVLLPFAAALPEADKRMREAITPQAIAEIVALIPDAWLDEPEVFADPAAHRQAYADYLTRRLAASHVFVEEAIRARSQLR